ncbi:MAG: hypothetical protein IKO73_03150 [Bacteroidaceae bacterium]|nr:hypothetical protein [Bacteroidaceae bacterium]
MSKKTKQKHVPAQAPKVESVEKKGRTLTFPLWPLPIIYSLVFVVFAWVFLIGKNADTLFFMQDRGYWNDSMVYFDHCMRMPGGFLSWIGSYFTQYFYYPAYGAAMLILLWMLSFCVAWRSFHVRLELTFLLFVPLLALLCTEVQLGYWVYFMRDIDYSFYHSLGFFFALLLSINYTRKIKYGGYIQMILVSVLFYYPLGIYALLATVLIALRLFWDNWRKEWKALVLLIALLGIVPLLETSGTTIMRLDECWLFGLKRFELGSIRDFRLEAPLWWVISSSLVIPFIGKRKYGSFGIKGLVASQLLMVVVAIGAYYIINERNCSDTNYYAELRMLRAVDEQRWDDVLNEARAAKGNPSRLMVMYRDIALMNKGELLNRYQYNNRPAKPSVMSDSIVVRLCDTTGDFIYYNFGETCFGIRRAIERSMHYGFSYYTMRVLARCALINGEYDNVRKYLRLLEHSTFQKKWAKEMRPYLEDTTLIASSPRFGLVKRLYNGGSSMVGSDDNFVEPTLIHKLAHTATDNPEILDLALAYCLQSKDMQCFWTQVWQYNNLFPEKPFPRYIQEAMLLYHYELKTGPEEINSTYHIDPQIFERYKMFIARVKEYGQSGMNVEQVGAALQPAFGDTYWWDYCVLREIQSY